MTIKNEGIPALRGIAILNDWVKVPDTNRRYTIKVERDWDGTMQHEIWIMDSSTNSGSFLSSEQVVALEHKRGVEDMLKEKRRKEALQEYQRARRQAIEQGVISDETATDTEQE